MIISFYNMGGGGGSAKLEEKNFTITQNGDTPIVPSEGFDGIFQGTITTNVQPKLQAKSQTITGNGQATITPDADYDGMSVVNVTVDVAATGSALDITGTGWETEPVFPVTLNRTASLNDDIEYTKTKFSEWDPSGTSLYGKYSYDTNLIYAPKIDTSKVTEMGNCFSDCSNLTAIPALDTSKVTNMSDCFYKCSSLTSIPALDTSKVTNMRQSFVGCSRLITIPALDTSSVTNMNSCFINCSRLTSVPALDTSKVTNMASCFSECNNLTNLGGFTDLKVSLKVTGYYKDFPLTKQSLLNVIAGLGQADPSFEAQPTLTLGSTNLAKLTAEEIAVGTAKGWQIVA